MLSDRAVTVGIDINVIFTRAQRNRSLLIKVIITYIGTVIKRMAVCYIRHLNSMSTYADLCIRNYISVFCKYYRHEFSEQRFKFHFHNSGSVHDFGNHDRGILRLISVLAYTDNILSDSEHKRAGREVRASVRCRKKCIMRSCLEEHTSSLLHSGLLLDINDLIHARGTENDCT